VDLHLQVDREHEALAALADDGFEPGVQVVCLRRGLRPVEREDERRHEFGRVHPRIDRVLAGAQRLLPDAAVTGPHDAAELEVGARRVQRRQADEALDDRDLALVDHQHRHHLDPDQERVEQIGAVQQRVVLHADTTAGRQERLEVLVVVVQGVLGAEQHVDQFGVGDGRVALHLGDVVEAAEPARDVARGERLALQGGDQADHVAGAVRRDHRDVQIVGGQPE
jgi:hypothetical protein